MVDPVAEYSDAWKHTVYGVLGGGSAWYVITMVWMQLPIYQRHFGLELANQLELGYNVGAAPAVLCVRLPARHPLTPQKPLTHPPAAQLPGPAVLAQGERPEGARAGAYVPGAHRRQLRRDRPHVHRRAAVALFLHLVSSARQLHRRYRGVHAAGQ